MAQGKRASKKSEDPTAQSPQRSPSSARSESSELSESPQKKKELRSDNGFPIVGLGASAGGLQSLQRFFGSVPARPGMAFVVVTHLDPDHESLMPEMLKKATDMEVVHIQDGMRVEPDTVYVIPPNKDLGIMKGVLQLENAERRGLRAPINRFFRLLAEDQGERAIAIVLSGLGSDGTVGIKVIKEKLGMVLAEDPDSARYDGMPRSAVETGMVDLVLLPADMFAKVKEYADRHYKLGKAALEERVKSDLDRSLPKVHMLLRSETGHDFSSYKRNTIVRRLERRMHVQQVDSIRDYVSFLRQHPAEIRILFKELLIGVTSFFRDAEAFDSLKERALRPLVASAPRNADLRLWVPGCSTGEEAYSLAIVLWEVMEDAKRFFDVQLFATDIDEEAVRIGRTGTYPGSVCADISPERLDKYFDKENGKYRIKRAIRDLMVFAVQSVIKDPPFTRLDLLCCRNLLIYLDAELQRKLLPLFHYSLKTGGYLFLGTSETIGRFTDLFESVDNKWKLFRARQAMPREHLFFPLTTPHREDEAKKAKPEPELEHIIIRRLLAERTPACVVADKKGEIAYIHGRTGRYLEPASGKPHLNVFDMAREGLKFSLQVLLQNAANQKAPVEQQARVKQNGTYQLVNLEAVPLGEGKVQDLYMIFFQPIAEEAQEKKKDTENLENGDRVRELEQELRTTKENLHTTVEELETANEELKSANEEHQSANEELQSANEELNSSKEELQSLNEELETVNSELQAKNEELHRKNQESMALLDEFNIPMLVLDERLRIVRFSNTINQIVSLRQSDIGRPIDDMASKLTYPDMVEDIREVVKTSVGKDIEAQCRKGRWFLIKMNPHRGNKESHGVMISFVDITRLRALEEMLEKTMDRLSLADDTMDVAKESFIVIDRDMRVLKTNPSFCTMFNIDKEAIEGKHLFESDALGWRGMKRLQNLLEKMMDKEEESAEVVVEYDEGPAGGKRLRFRAQAMVLDDGFVKVLLNIRERQ